MNFRWNNALQRFPMSGPGSVQCQQLDQSFIGAHARKSTRDIVEWLQLRQVGQRYIGLSSKRDLKVLCPKAH